MMIDEQVKKGLEYCVAESGFNNSCKICSYFGDCYSTAGTGKQLHKDALALINRLEEKIDDIHYENENLQTYIDNIDLFIDDILFSIQNIAQEHGVEVDDD